MIEFVFIYKLQCVRGLQKRVVSNLPTPPYCHQCAITDVWIIQRWVKKRKSKTHIRYVNSNRLSIYLSMHLSPFTKFQHLWWWTDHRPIFIQPTSEFHCLFASPYLSRGSQGRQIWREGRNNNTFYYFMCWLLPWHKRKEWLIFRRHFDQRQRQMVKQFNSWSPRYCFARDYVHVNLNWVVNCIIVNR